MGHPLLLFLWCALSVVGLVASQAVVECSDEPVCKTVKVLAQKRQDIENVFLNNQGIQNADLSGNLLNQLSALQNANQLRSLNLSYNLLEEDVLRDARYPQLQNVDLTYNQLTVLTLPTTVTTLRAVRNRLVRISFQRNSGLRELFLSMNHFDTLNDFASLKSLTTLDLSCNRIREVSSDQLSTMTSLVYLNLANNHIHALTGSRALPKLEFLDLSNNLLTYPLLSSMPELKELYIQKNRIVMVTKNAVMPKLQGIDVSGNDWDCDNLKNLLDANSQAIPKPESSQCPQHSVKNICCSNSPIPFAERLIKYHKNEFYALQVSGTQKKSGYNCKDYTPSACDGDDNLVYTVAGAAVKDVQSLAKASQQRLSAELRRNENLLNTARNGFQSYINENAQIEASLNELNTFIQEKYASAGLSAPGESPAKLKALLEQYEHNHNQLQQQIDSEERNHQDQLREITDIQGQLDDLQYRQEVLLNDVNKRNATVTGYQTKINDLRKRLGGTKLN